MLLLLDRTCRPFPYKNPMDSLPITQQQRKIWPEEFLGFHLSYHACKKTKKTGVMNGEVHPRQPQRQLLPKVSLNLNVSLKI